MVSSRGAAVAAIACFASSRVAVVQGQMTLEQCPHLDSPACATPSVQRFMDLWKDKVKCWLCPEVTKALMTESVGLLNEAVSQDIPVTVDNGLTRPWLQTCLPAYVLAMLMTTRSQILQPWRIYDFGLSIMNQCRYDELEFFKASGVTPGQVQYVFSLIGHQWNASFRLQALQQHERGNEGLDEESYASKTPWDAPLVVDVGMGLGADARYYLQQGFRVVGVEANPEAIDAAITDKATAEHLRTGWLSIVNAAVAAEDSSGSKTSFFVLPKRPEQSKAQEWILQDGAVEVSVRGVTCANLLHVFGEATYMKVDVESNTIDCLESLHHEAQKQKAAGKSWAPPRYLSLEVEAHHLVELFYPRLVDLGYHQYKAMRQFMFSPGPCEASYRSEILGCGSGPFGEAAVDYLVGPEWRSISELPQDKGFLKEFDSGFDWFDLHFKRTD